MLSLCMFDTTTRVTFTDSVHLCPNEAGISLFSQVVCLISLHGYFVSSLTQESELIYVSDKK